MSVYKRLHMLKSLYKATVVGLLLGCVLCYNIGYSRARAKAAIEIEHAEMRCLEQF